MPTKKANPKKSTEQTAPYKIGGQIGELAHEVVAGKDHLTEMAENAIESVKTTFKNITAPKAALKKSTKAVVKKAAPKKASVKKSVKAAVKKVVKKSPAKIIKKTAKKLIKKR